MAINYKEIELVINELSLSSSYIQHIKQINDATLVLECYKPQNVTKVAINLNALYSSIYKISTSFPQINHTHHFVQRIKATLRGSKIISLSQPGYQRIIMFHVKHYNEEYYLCVKLWASHSNIYLCNHHFNILDSFYPEKKRASSFTFPFKMVNQSFNIRNFDGFDTLSSFLADDIDQKERKKALDVLTKVFTNRQKALLIKREQLNQQISYSQQFDKNREMALLIQSQKKGICRGMTSVNLINYYDDSSIISVKLNQKFDAKENANFYYKQYHKQQQAFILANNALIELTQELQNLETAYHQQIQNKAPVLDYKNKFRATIKKENNQPGLMLTFNSYRVLIGRNANENDNLLRHYAKGLDWWFHVRDYSGGYIIVKNQANKSLPIEVKLAACALAVHFSKAKSNPEALIHYSQIKHIRRIKNGPKGAVSVLKDFNIAYKVESSRIENLLAMLKNS